MSNQKTVLPESKFYPLSIPDTWSGIELSSVYDDGQGNVEVTHNPNNISYYSVYLKDLNGEANCIADLITLAEAKAFCELLVKSVLNYKEDNDVEKSYHYYKPQPQDTKEEDFIELDVPISTPLWEDDKPTQDT